MEFTNIRDYVEAKITMTYCQGGDKDVEDAVRFWKRIKAQNVPGYQEDSWVRQVVLTVETIETLGESFVGKRSQ